VSRVAFLDGRAPDQIGILVSDLEASLERYERLWGGGPWRIYTYGRGHIAWVTYREQLGTHRMRLALSVQKPQIELIQSLEGPSIYEEHLATRGEGLHHLGFHVESLDEATGAMADAGYSVIQSGGGFGLDGDGGYAYFDTERDLGVVLEAIEVPKRRREPELLWPPQGR
jgi:catechol 2,3-dioxygenase-like lactoylglutathione lyase family enzyme